AGVDQALADLGKSDAEVTEVRSRHKSATAVDLNSVDGELDMLSTAFSFDGESTDLHDESPVAAQEAAGIWEDEHTEVEMLDESDFVLLVDENELEEIERAGEDDARKTTPVGAPDIDQPAEGEGSFFKKLFGGRRNSSNP
ncbi:MAG: hypothetical protein KJN97_16130, partial [Deltaproteobacteria bacterium]|nr:hypothetical protein [Deltaproteobacteria bacterium]